MKYLFSILLCAIQFSVYAQSEVYELRSYELEFTKPASVLHDYFEKALIPALNRQGIDNVGAFEEASMNMPKKVFLLIRYPNINKFQSVQSDLLKDDEYQNDAVSYLKADPSTMPYNIIDVHLIQSTTGFPEFTKPDDDSELFELRIYESYNEDALRRKVKMFNDSEFEIFEEVGLPMVFFGSNLAGGNMPCLTYMLAFKDMKHHEEAWVRFLDHPEWKRIVGLEEYKDAMNEIIRIFLKPTAYSQL